MTYASLLISALALALSAFTFYWVQLRISHKLHLVRIDIIGEMHIPRFALVNSGTRDILLTSVACCFEDKKNTGCTYPSQKVHIGAGPSMLLKAGTAVQCSVVFPDPFTSAFAAEGTLRPGTTPDVYERVLRIEVGWVDSAAHSHSGMARIGMYGWSINGDIRMFSPLERKHDLYRSS